MSVSLHDKLSHLSLIFTLRVQFSCSPEPGKAGTESKNFVLQQPLHLCSDLSLIYAAVLKQQGTYAVGVTATT